MLLHVGVLLESLSPWDSHKVELLWIYVKVSKGTCFEKVIKSSKHSIQCAV